MLHSHSGNSDWMLLQGEAQAELNKLEDGCIQCVITSPPYWALRDYGNDEQVGLEASPIEYITRLTDIFREVRRVLKPDGVCWIVIGDSYAGKGGGKQGKTGQRATRTFTAENIRNKSGENLKDKDLVAIPWELGLAMRADGWWLRHVGIWHKPNAMPARLKDRPTVDYEYVLMLTKSAHYYYDHEAGREPRLSPAREVKDWREREYDQSFLPKNMQQRGKKGRPSGPVSSHPTLRNRRSVWSIATTPFTGAHFAVYPEKLVDPLILTGSQPGDVVLDPFAGSGTTGVVALRHHRKFVGIDLNHEYCDIARTRIIESR